jgi:hypothetical protein
MKNIYSIYKKYFFSMIFLTNHITDCVFDLIAIIQHTFLHEKVVIPT